MVTETAAPPSEEKRRLRNELRTTLTSYSQEWFTGNIGSICERLRTFLAPHGTFDSPILGWVPTFEGEPAVHQILSEVSEAGVLFLPRVRTVTSIMEFVKVEYPWNDRLTRGAGGTWDPPDGPLYDPDTAGRQALLILPGLAFDRLGYRLGRGWGCYDRFIAAHRSQITTIGVCWSFQIVERVPCDSWDQPVDYLVTEVEVIKRGIETKDRR